ncbi:unnamed protein product [Lathyrus sativus]|nr:unnamed protein product [Lathyrus sativus]
MMMREGRVVQSGKYDELLKAGLDFGALVAAHESSMEILETSDNSNDDSSQSLKLACIVSKEKKSGVEKQSSQDQSKFDDKTAAKLIEDEGRETGHVSLKVYKQYFTEAFRWWGIALVVVMSAGWVLSFLAGDYWLAIATSDGFSWVLT